MGKYTLYLPVKHKLPTSIHMRDGNSYERWEETFRVHAGIFAQANPLRSSELLQHMANI